MMKIVIYLLCFVRAFTYNVNPNQNLFQPAPYVDRSISNEISPPKFFLATFYPQESRRDHLNEQVLSTVRKKRDTAGALHIMTNHAQPIHADVKPDSNPPDITEKPCPKSKNIPSHVENGVVFQVTAPEDTFELKSLRKSWPLPSKLNLVRSISRISTLIVLMASAVVEFFPLLRNAYSAVYSFIYL